ncbi:hypothetical protein PHISCL_01900 [Aspergillus sclerotialis]|uniref:Uncharacterized protein n=1 Tax=Aspergillus sclerotialis TaxID=2070753 RepID=A0A3A2ZWL6_9EURO|nr:hypothetical protein PHISCL_01900 [Aspergillus sclerotialis]
MASQEDATTPAADPPPGHVSDLQNPPSSGDYWIGAITVLMAIMFVFVCLRFYVKRSIKRAATLDDCKTGKDFDTGRLC